MHNNTHPIRFSATVQGCDVWIERYFSAGSSNRGEVFVQAISQIEFERESFFWLLVIWTNIWRESKRNKRKRKMISQQWYIIYTNSWYFPENMILINGVYLLWILNLWNFISLRGSLDRLRRFLTLIVLLCWRLFCCYVSAAWYLLKH